MPHLAIVPISVWTQSDVAQLLSDESQLQPNQSELQVPLLPFPLRDANFRLAQLHRATRRQARVTAQRHRATGLIRSACL